MSDEKAIKDAEAEVTRRYDAWRKADAAAQKADIDFHSKVVVPAERAYEEAESSGDKDAIKRTKARRDKVVRQLNNSDDPFLRSANEAERYAHKQLEKAKQRLKQLKK